MKKITCVDEVLINAPIHTVWGIYDDPEWKPRLDPSFVAYIGIGDGPKQVGKRHRVVLRQSGRNMEFEDLITEYDPPRRVTITAIAQFGLRLDQTLELSERGESRTLCRRNVLLSVPLIMRPLSGFIVRKTIASTTALLGSLRMFAEQLAHPDANDPALQRSGRP